MRRDQRCVAQALFSASMLPYFVFSQSTKRSRSACEYDMKPLPISLSNPIANSAGCLA